MISFKDFIVFVLENKEDRQEYCNKEEIQFFEKKKDAIKYKKEKKLNNYQVAERILIDNNFFNKYNFEEALFNYTETHYLPRITEEEDER